MQLGTKHGCPLSGADRWMKGAARPAAEPRGEAARGWQRGRNGPQPPPQAAALPQACPSPRAQLQGSAFQMSVWARDSCPSLRQRLRAPGRGFFASRFAWPGQAAPGPLLQEWAGPVPGEDYTSQRAARRRGACRERGASPPAAPLPPRSSPPAGATPPALPEAGWGLVPPAALSDFPAAQ